MLAGALSTFPDAQPLGVDLDFAAVAAMRRRWPKGIFSNCDALKPSSLFKSRVWRVRDQVDVVLANPPFGQRSRRMLEISSWGRRIRCGLAAAHVLAALRNFSPEKMVVIVPQSLLYSERDSAALQVITTKYRMENLMSVGRDGFHTANATVNVLRFTRRSMVNTRYDAANDDPHRHLANVALVRGGIPMHVVNGRECRSGIQLCHTRTISGRMSPIHVRPISRGVVSGHLVLLPRVGFPRMIHLRRRSSSSPIQLSDCVLAICCRSVCDADSVASHLTDIYDELLSCWRGTGAPYTSIKRLQGFLNANGVATTCHANWPDVHGR